VASGLSPYQYVVLRCVPRPEREEFINVGAVLYCPDAEFLRSASYLDETRVNALAPGFDLERFRAALATIERICAGTAHTSFGAGVRATAYGDRALEDNQSARFGLLKAPRSTVLQPGPVHGGMTADPEAELAKLVARQTGTSSSEPTA
jgi:hypothetical protein